MEQLALGILEKSKTKVIAEGLNGFNGFKIELIEKIGSDDIAQLIEVSEELVKKFGDSAKLTKSNR